MRSEVTFVHRLLAIRLRHFVATPAALVEGPWGQNGWLLNCVIKTCQVFAQNQNKWYKHPLQHSQYQMSDDKTSDKWCLHFVSNQLVGIAEEQLRGGRVADGGEVRVAHKLKSYSRLLDGFLQQNFGQDRLMQSTQRTSLNQYNHHFLQPQCLFWFFCKFQLSSERIWVAIFLI